MPISPIRVEPSSIRESVYLTIKQRIAQLLLTPGTGISTQEVAEQLHVSRTPVREAFIRLEKEDLVKILPQKGTIISLIDMVRAEQERFIRESLELAVIPQFIAKYTAAHVQQFEELISLQMQCFEKQNFLEFILYDNLFHKVFFDAAEQSLSWDAIMSTNSHYNRLRVLTVRNTVVLRSAIEQHKGIVRLVLKKDVEALQHELSDHMQKINVEKTELVKQYPDFFAEPTAPTVSLSPAYLL